MGFRIEGDNYVLQANGVVKFKAVDGLTDRTRYEAITSITANDFEPGVCRIAVEVSNGEHVFGLAYYVKTKKEDLVRDLHAAYGFVLEDK